MEVLKMFSISAQDNNRSSSSSFAQTIIKHTNLPNPKPDNYIKPVKSHTDKNGTWWIEFKEKDVKELFEKYKVEKTKWWQFWR